MRLKKNITIETNNQLHFEAYLFFGSFIQIGVILMVQEVS
jgi:hypothetical protein